MEDHLKQVSMTHRFPQPLMPGRGIRSLQEHPNRFGAGCRTGIVELPSFLGASTLLMPRKIVCCSGWQFIMIPAGSWDVSAVEVLLQFGANPNEPGRLLSGAVMEPFAFLMQQVIFYDKPLKKAEKIAELLGKAGANVNVPLTGNKETALHLFADACNVEGVELLLRLHAKTNIKSEHDETAKEGAEYAVKNECKSPEDKERLMKAFDLKEE